MTAQREAIIAELYKAVEKLGAGRELLAVIGSWGDTLSDEDVLEALQHLNAGRPLFDEVWAGRQVRDRGAASTAITEAALARQMVAEVHAGQFRFIIAGEPGGDRWIASPA